MSDTDLLYFKERLDTIDWNGDFEKADKENYEILDKLCEEIEAELGRNRNFEIIAKALLLLAENVGCIEDFERYEENFVNRLVQDNLLTKNSRSYFIIIQTGDKVSMLY